MGWVKQVSKCFFVNFRSLRGHLGRCFPRKKKCLLISTPGLFVGKLRESEFTSCNLELLQGKIESILLISQENIHFCCLVLPSHLHFFSVSSPIIFSPSSFSFLRSSSGRNVRHSTLVCLEIKQNQSSDTFVLSTAPD